MSEPTCDYLRQGDEGRRRCGNRAVFWRWSAARVQFFYCENCARYAQDDSRGKLALHKVIE